MSDHNPVLLSMDLSVYDNNRLVWNIGRVENITNDFP